MRSVYPVIKQNTEVQCGVSANNYHFHCLNRLSQIGLHMAGKLFYLVIVKQFEAVLIKYILT